LPNISGEAASAGDNSPKCLLTGRFGRLQCPGVGAAMEENITNKWDVVFLHASKGGNSEAAQMSRGSAEARRQEFEADGWAVDVFEISADED